MRTCVGAFAYIELDPEDFVIDEDGRRSNSKPVVWPNITRIEANLFGAVIRWPCGTTSGDLFDVPRVVPPGSMLRFAVGKLRMKAQFEVPEPSQN